MKNDGAVSELDNNIFSQGNTWLRKANAATAFVIVSTMIFGFAQEANQSTHHKIKITISGKEMTATLNDSEASKDFISLLPLELPLEDFASTEKIGYLPKKLTTERTPKASDQLVGDVAYYAPWGNLAFFYKGTTAQSNDLFILGKIDRGKEVLRASGSLKAKIELIKSEAGNRK